MSTPQSVFDYYQKNVSGEAQEAMSIYGIWEKGGSFLDSVTPSTYSSEYRELIVERLLQTIDHNREKRILSVGCGNAFVEAELVARGYKVFAIDINSEAVELAMAKSVPAKEIDFFDFNIDGQMPFDLIYADGFFGHLYSAKEGCGHVIKKAMELLSPVGSILISNDGPSDNSLVQAHKSVPDFFYLSTQFLKQQGENFGFVATQISSYVYNRPLSGPRQRSLVTLTLRAN